MFKSVLKLIILCLVITSFSNSACADNKIIRVGWYDSPFNYMDNFNRRSGYAYEFQQKIAAYTGWTYEYINGSWPDLYNMLVNGQIDILSDVSYTPERANLMLFPTLPMGAESYYLFVSSSNNSITRNNLASLNGKKVGVNSNSYQGTLFQKWAADNGINVQLIGLNDIEKNSLARVESGELNGVLKDYLELAENCTRNAKLNFEAKSYSTLQDAFQALENNEVDCVFPVHLGIHDAESMGIMTTNPFIQTEMYLMTSKSSQKVISADQEIVVAINGTNANFELLTA